MLGGGSWYYLLDGVASVISGYLFVMNNYIPMFICLGFVVISTILSLGFRDVYEVKPKQNQKKEKILKEYGKDLKSSFKFIFKSKRMKSYILFQVVFYSLIKIIEIYQSDLLVDIGMPEEEFSMIFAVLILIGGISITLKRKIEKKFKNRTLAFLSIAYILATIMVGTVSSINPTKMIVPIILIMYAIQNISKSIWFILEAKYLRNFTNEKTRNKITFSYEVIGGIAASIASILAGLMLKVVSIENAFLIIGLISLIGMILVLDYMRTRFGLRPNQYSKEDIEFEIEK